MKPAHVGHPRSPVLRANVSFAVVSLLPAQTPSTTSVAHVPFDFFVGEMRLGAGPYALGPSKKSGMRILCRADADVPQIMVQAIRVPFRQDAVPSRLLFYCQRDRYFLAQVLADVA